MKSLCRSAAVAALLVALLTACGGSGSDGDDADGGKPTATASASQGSQESGTEITTDEFTYTVPPGWEESEESRALSLAIDLQDKDGFSDNINVVRDNTVAAVDGDQLEKSVENVLQSVNATGISVKDRIEIDGEEAVHVGAVFESNGKKYRTEQYAVSHRDKGYVVTVSFSPDVPEAQRDTVSESILATWSWTS
jgi:hypothetical protein